MSNITSLKNWSTTEASNQPDTTDAFTITGDLRAIQVAVRNALSTQDTIASATTTDLGSKDAGTLTISGTTTITGLGTVSAGIRKRVLFSGILTLTHSGTALILPGAANITTAANDRAEFESLGSGNWRCNYYVKASGLPVLTTGLAASGANTDITSLTACTALTNAAGIDIKGTNTNDSAAAGDVGEVVSASVASGSAVALVTGVTNNVVTISLTAGEWDITGVVAFAPAATTNSTYRIAGASSTSATLGTLGTYATNTSPAQVTGAIDSIHPVPTIRFQLAGTTTIYLVAQAAFTVSTMGAYGTIRARRVR